MLRNFNLILVLVVLLLTFTTSTYAFDGNRQGFILGLGVGPGLTSYSFEGIGTDDRTNKASVNTDFQIGYAPNNQLLIYWMSKVQWYSLETIFGSAIYASGVGGLGLSYYFEKEGPSLYLTGGVGFASVAAPFEDNIETEYGFGIAAGVGYEFAKHWSVEGNFTWGNPGDVITMKTIGLNIIIKGLAY